MARTACQGWVQPEWPTDVCVLTRRYQNILLRSKASSKQGNIDDVILFKIISQVALGKYSFCMP